MPRLFTGIEIPPAVAAELTSLRGGLPGARLDRTRGLSSSPSLHRRVGVALANKIAHGLDSRPRDVRSTVAIEGSARSAAKSPERSSRVPARIRCRAARPTTKGLIRRIGAAPDTRKFVPPRHPRSTAQRDSRKRRVPDGDRVVGSARWHSRPRNSFVFLARFDGRRSLSHRGRLSAVALSARGCADRYASSSRAESIAVYIWVVDSDACPSNSWIVRRSPPRPSRCVAKE